MPLPTNILAEDIREIIKEAECAALVVSLREVPALAPIVGACHTVRKVIIMDRWRTLPWLPHASKSTAHRVAHRLLQHRRRSHLILWDAPLHQPVWGAVTVCASPAASRCIMGW